MTSSLDDLKQRRPVLFGLALAVLLSVAAPAAAETVQSELVLIRAEDVVVEDLYAVGQRVQIDGRIEGDLVTVGLEEVRVTGTVTGSVFAAGASVVVTGDVQGSLRVAARDVRIEGSVGGDVLAASWTLTETETGEVERDVIAAAWRLALGGVVGRDVEGRFRHALIDGTVGGGVEIVASRAAVGSGGVVTDDLSVRSGRPVDIADAATIQGEVVERSPLNPNVRVTAIGLLFRLLAALGGTLAGLAMMWHDPERVDAIAAEIGRRPVAVVLYGLLAMLGPPAVIALLFGLVGLMPPAASLPLLLFTIPVAIGILTIQGVAALLAPVPSAVRLGSVVMSGRSTFARFLLGMAALTLIAFIPVFGVWVVIGFLLLGFGAWLAAPEPVAS